MDQRFRRHPGQGLYSTVTESLRCSAGELTTTEIDTENVALSQKCADKLSQVTWVASPANDQGVYK